MYAAKSLADEDEEEKTEIVEESGSRMSTWTNRIQRHLEGVHPEDTIDDYNRQAMYSCFAQANGWIIGRGPGNSEERARLPLAFSDYIFAIIVEDTGFVGGTILLALYLFLIARAGRIASNCSRAFPAFLIMGCAILIVFQALVHMAITTGTMELGEGGKMIISGPMGATGMQKLSTFPMGFALIMFTLFVVLNLVNSKEGRAIKAVRDNRIAAESVGINVTAFRLKAFVVSAFLAGMAGALYGLNYSSLTASKFNFNTSINILVFVVLGGMGNILGSVISATVLYVLPEAMRGLQDYRMILYAIVLILVMLFTWSPKFKDLVAITKAKLFGNKMKKEVGSK